MPNAQYRYLSTANIWVAVIHQPQIVAGREVLTNEEFRASKGVERGGESPGWSVGKNVPKRIRNKGYARCFGPFAVVQPGTVFTAQQLMSFKELSGKHKNAFIDHFHKAARNIKKDAGWLAHVAIPEIKDLIPDVLPVSPESKPVVQESEVKSPSGNQIREDHSSLPTPAPVVETVQLSAASHLLLPPQHGPGELTRGTESTLSMVAPTLPAENPPVEDSKMTAPGVVHRPELSIDEKDEEEKRVSKRVKRNHHGTPQIFFSLGIQQAASALFDIKEHHESQAVGQPSQSTANSSSSASSNDEPSMSDVMDCARSLLRL
jgi:hypothetical protein